MKTTLVLVLVLVAQGLAGCTVNSTTVEQTIKSPVPARIGNVYTDSPLNASGYYGGSYGSYGTISQSPYYNTPSTVYIPGQSLNVYGSAYYSRTSSPGYTNVSRGSSYSKQVVTYRHR
ncbi:hypothetical protein KW783_04265 [Candidatus Parcubacteria bacterium]|nr:hypothetical protein [Candidatus Parcubacteria bacterium]